MEEMVAVFTDEENALSNEVNRFFYSLQKAWALSFVKKQKNNQRMTQIDDIIEIYVENIKSHQEKQTETELSNYILYRLKSEVKNRHSEEQMISFLNNQLEMKLNFFKKVFGDRSMIEREKQFFQKTIDILDWAGSNVISLIDIDDAETKRLHAEYIGLEG
jgi:hypothetical protein